MQWYETFDNPYKFATDLFFNFLVLVESKSGISLDKDTKEWKESQGEVVNDQDNSVMFNWFI